MRRYLTLGLVQLKAAVLLSLQYRLDFVIETAMALFWCGTALVPLLVLFSMRDSVAGFSAYQALTVTGFFMALKGMMVGAIQPSLVGVVEHVRKGTLDFLLLKPVDAQFMLSTSKLELPRIVDVLVGLGLAAYCIDRSGARPSVLQVAAALIILLCAVGTLYGLWIMVISLAFRVVKIDNLSHLILSVFDAARFPVSVFRGALAIVFTFVIPLGLMTTYPTLALMGRLGWFDVAVPILVAAGFLGVSRRIWLRSIRLYTGAGG